MEANKGGWGNICVTCKFRLFTNLISRTTRYTYKSLFRALKAITIIVSYRISRMCKKNLKIMRKKNNNELANFISQHTCQSVRLA